MPNIPPSPPVAPVAESFDLLLFWELHKKTILAGLGAVVLALLVWAGWQWNQYRQEQASQAAFAAATKPEDLENITRDFRGTMSAGNAMLLLAEQQRAAKQYDQSAATLRAFLAQNPKHPLAGTAALSLALTLESQGKTDEAMQTYQEVVARHGGDYVAPMALLAEAALHQRHGQSEEARRLYEKVIADYPKSFFVPEAESQLRAVKREEPTQPAKPEMAAPPTEPAK